MNKAVSWPVAHFQFEPRLQEKKKGARPAETKKEIHKNRKSYMLWYLIITLATKYEVGYLKGVRALIPIVWG